MASAVRLMFSSEEVIVLLIVDKSNFHKNRRKCCIPEDHKIRPLTDSKVVPAHRRKLFVDILRKCLRIATSPKDQAQSSGSSPGTAMAFRWIDKTDPPWSCSPICAFSYGLLYASPTLVYSTRTPAFQGISDITETTPAYRPSPVCSHIPPPDHSRRDRINDDTVLLCQNYSPFSWNFYDMITIIESKICAVRISTAIFE